MAATQDENVSARKNRWHQSTLSTILDGCSLQYYFAYVKGLDQGFKPHALVGSSFHHAVEHFEKARIEDKNSLLSLEDMLLLGKEYLTENLPKDETDYTEQYERLRDAVTNWYEELLPMVLTLTPVAIEPEFTIDLVEGSKPIGGYIDAIYKNDKGEYIIVDWKTAKNFDRWRSSDGHRHQATMYAVALVLSPDFPDITELPPMYYFVARTSRSARKDFDKTRIVTLQPDIEDVKMLGDRIRKAQSIIETNSYAPNTKWFLCSATWCPFYNGCQVTGELLEDPNLGIEIKHQQSNTTTYEGGNND